MRYSSPRSPRRRRPFHTTPAPSRSATWLSYIGVLLFGAGITAIGLEWAKPKPSYNSPLPPAQVEADRQSPDASTRDEDSQRTTRQTNSRPVEVPNATVCVKGPIPNGSEVCASGVSIDPRAAGVDADTGSVVVTNYHVIANTGNRPPVQLRGEGDRYDTEVIKQSPEMDLALLFVPGVRLPAAALADSSPNGGTPVRAIGFPNNRPLTIRDSTLLGTTRNCLAIAPCLAIKQGTITHGNSGGPLEASGKVIGITQGETTEEIAIPIEQVRQFLSDEVPSSDVLPQLEPGYPPGPPGPPGFPLGRPGPPPYGGPPPGWWR